MNGTRLRRGFTMIELIFVIVIIGILAAVAIPKLAANRDDAEAATCVHEMRQIVNEIQATYTAEGYTNYSTMAITDMTNIGQYTVGGSATKGLGQTTPVHLQSVQYYCDSFLVMTMRGQDDPNGVYSLLVAVDNTYDSPASTMASQDFAAAIGADPVTTFKYINL